MSDTNIVTTTSLSSDGSTAQDLTIKDQVKVKVHIQYAEDHQGEKYFKHGEVKHDISEETAAAFVKAGFGTIVSAEEAAEIEGNVIAEKEEGPDTPKKKPYSVMNKAELQQEMTARELVFEEADTKKDLIALLQDADEEAAKKNG